MPDTYARMLGVRLCKMWGLDPNKVKNINIDIQPGDHITVLVTLTPSFVDVYDILDEVREYRLLPEGLVEGSETGGS